MGEEVAKQSADVLTRASSNLSERIAAANEAAALSVGGNIAGQGTHVRDVLREQGALNGLVNMLRSEPVCRTASAEASHADEGVTAATTALMNATAFSRENALHVRPNARCCVTPKSSARSGTTLPTRDRIGAAQR